MKVLLLVYRTSQGYFFSYSESFNGYKDLDQAKKELSYDGYHAAGSTWSTSATIYWMNFRPCVVELDFDNIKQYLKEEKLYNLNSISGYQKGVPIKDESKSFIDENIVYDPKLISESFSEKTKPFYVEQD